MVSARFSRRVLKSRGCARSKGGNEVVSIVEWKSPKAPSSQLSVLFKFKGNKIYEERWHIDTEQRKSLF